MSASEEHAALPVLADGSQRVKTCSRGPQTQGAATGVTVEQGWGWVTWLLPRPRLVRDRRARFLLGHQVKGAVVTAGWSQRRARFFVHSDIGRRRLFPADAPSGAGSEAQGHFRVHGQD